MNDRILFSRQFAHIYGILFHPEPVSAAGMGMHQPEKPFSRGDLLAGVVDGEREEVSARLKAFAAQKAPFRISFHIRADGRKKRVYIEGNFALDAAGNIIGSYGILQDITRQYAYEKQLEYKEKLLESVSEAIVATDTDFMITGWNKGAERMYGWTAEEVIGKNARVLLHTELIGGLSTVRVVQQIIEKGSGVYHVLQSRKDGARIWVLSTTSKLVDDQGRLIGFVGINQDISELVRVKEELLTHQAHLQTLLNNSPDAIYLLDRESRLLAMNEGFERNFKRQFNVTLSIGDKITEKVPPALAPALQLALNRALAGEHFTQEAALPDDAGRQHTFETLIGPVKNSTGEITGVVAYTRNISDRKEVQRQAILMEVERQKIEAASLVAGQEYERARLIKEFHDGIGQMLNVLKLKIDSLRDHADGHEQDLADISALTSQTIADAKALVRDAMPYNLEHLGLPGAIRNLVAQYEGNSRLGIAIKLWINLTRAKFDKTTEVFIYRIIQECVNNTIRHAEARNLTIQLTQLADGLLLMVEDDGIGFDYDQAPKNRKDSSGLRNITERCSLMKAEIEVDTQPGHGCTINIKVPV